MRYAYAVNLTNTDCLIKESSNYGPLPISLVNKNDLHFMILRTIVSKIWHRSM